MSGRSHAPGAMPGLLAELTAAAPGRIVRKLDKKPGLAGGWSWSVEGDRVEVETDRGEVVTLKASGGVVRGVDDVGCTCLLSPRCLHVLAVVSSLEIAEQAEEAPAGGSGGAEEESGAAGEPGAGDLVELSQKQLEAALACWTVGAQLLEHGAAAAGAVHQSELLRAVHSCQLAGMYRLAATGLRIVRAVRDLRLERPEFSLPVIAADMLELLDTSWRLSSPADDPARERLVPPSLVGTARRAYTARGSLRLFGLFVQPVAAASGYAGVVTYLCDREGIRTISDVKPGEPGRSKAAYVAGAAIGDVSVPHRQLCREGLLIQGATGSADGRLGSGASVRAVRSGPSSWQDEVPDSLWKQGLEAQLDRAFDALSLAPAERPAGTDLLFASGVVLGAHENALCLSVLPAPHGSSTCHDASPMLLRATAPSQHSELCFQENLRLLACAPGLALRLIGRVRFQRPLCVELLAVGEPAEQDPIPEIVCPKEPPFLRLPKAWGSRCNLGLDRLQRSYLAHAEKTPAPVLLAAGDGGPVDPLEHLRRRLRRMVMGGRASLPSGAVVELGRESALLRRRMMPSAASLLSKLAEVAVSASRKATGERGSGDPALLAHSWLAAAAYERAATRALHRSAWAR